MIPAPTVHCDIAVPTPAPAFQPVPEELPRQLQKFLEGEWGGPISISGWRRFPVGMSWVTIGFQAHLRTGETRDLILRLGDPKGLLAPYSTEPEYQALAALADVPSLPVPRVWLRSEDTTLMGAPFIVVERVEGDTPTPWGDSLGCDESERESLANEFSDALGALHAFDWTNTPLAAWAEGLTRENVACRETARWAQAGGYPDAPLPPQMHYAMRWLQANAPIAERIVPVHGDYRVGNFLRKGRKITAILDWELVHLGDPHEDLAWAALRAFAGGTPRIGGLVDAEVFHRRYTGRSGLRVDQAKLRYYQVLMQFKSAAMLLGAARRVDARRAGDVRIAALSFQLAASLIELNRLIREAPWK